MWNSDRQRFLEGLKIAAHPEYSTLAAPQ